MSELQFKHFANPISGDMWVSQDARGRNYVVLKMDGLYTASTRSILNGRGHTFHIISYSEGVMTREEAENACRKYEASH